MHTNTFHYKSEAKVASGAKLIEKLKKELLQKNVKYDILASGTLMLS